MKRVVSEDDSGLEPFETGARRIDCHGASVAGSKRMVNQDDYLILPLGSFTDEIRFLSGGGLPRDPGPLLFVVADGLGGAPAGECASSLAISEMRRTLSSTFGGRAPGASDTETLLKTAVHRAQQAIEQNIRRHAERAGMGTTLTAALVLWPKVHVVHVGDSRCYVLHRSSWEQVTTDHTVAQQLADGGLLAGSGPGRWSHVLWNVLGGKDPQLYPEVATLDLRWGDALLLATDGLTDSLPDTEIFRLASEGLPSEAVCAELIEAGRKRKGTDDMTVVYAQFGRAIFWRRLREIFLDP